MFEMTEIVSRPHVRKKMPTSTAPRCATEEARLVESECCGTVFSCSFSILRLMKGRGNNRENAGIRTTGTQSSKRKFDTSSARESRKKGEENGRHLRTSNEMRFSSPICEIEEENHAKRAGSDHQKHDSPRAEMSPVRINNKDGLNQVGRTKNLPVARKAEQPAQNK